MVTERIGLAAPGAPAAPSGRPLRRPRDVGHEPRRSTTPTTAEWFSECKGTQRVGGGGWAEVFTVNIHVEDQTVVEVFGQGSLSHGSDVRVYILS